MHRRLWNYSKRYGKGAELRIKRYLKDENYPVKVIMYSMERGVYMG